MINECNLLPGCREEGTSKKEIWRNMDSGLQVQLEEDGGRAGWRQVAYAAVGVTRHNSSQMENVTRVVYGYPTFCTFFVIPYCNI